MTDSEIVKFGQDKKMKSQASKEQQVCLEEFKVKTTEKTSEAKVEIKPSRKPKFINKTSSCQNTTENEQIWFSKSSKDSISVESSVSNRETVTIVKPPVFSEQTSNFTSNEANVSIVNLEKEKSEIVSAARSLKTNIILTSIVFLIFVCLAFVSDSFNIFIGSAMKGLIPILTTIANFGKIQTVLLLYCKNSKNKMESFWAHFTVNRYSNEIGC